MKEGNAYTNLLKLMSEQGYNKDVKVTIGVVKSVSPLTVSVDTFVIDSSDYFKTAAVARAINDPNDPLQPGHYMLVLIDGMSFYLIDRVM